MYKTDEFIICPALGLLVEQSKTLCFESLHFGYDIFYLKGNVMDTLSAFCYKFGNRASIGSRFQQFDFGFAELKKRGVSPFFISKICSLFLNTPT